MDWCNVLLRHGHLPPPVLPSFEENTARVQEIRWKAVHRYIMCTKGLLGLLPHEICNGPGD